MDGNGDRISPPGRLVVQDGSVRFMDKYLHSLIQENVRIPRLPNPFLLLFETVYPPLNMRVLRLGKANTPWRRKTNIRAAASNERDH